MRVRKSFKKLKKKSFDASLRDNFFFLPPFLPSDRSSTSLLFFFFFFFARFHLPRSEKMCPQHSFSAAEVDGFAARRLLVSFFCALLRSWSVFILL